MTKALFQISKFIAVVLVAVYSVVFLLEGRFLRVFEMWVLTILFLIVLVKYEKKFKVFSTSMIFYVMVCFFSMSYCPFIYTDEKLEVLRQSRPQGSITPNDHFDIYFIVALIVSMAILFYIHFKKMPKQRTTYRPIVATVEEDWAVLSATIFIIIPMALFVGGEIVVAAGVASFVYFFGRAILNNFRVNLPICLGIISTSIYLLFKVLIFRFQLLKYILPIIIIIILMYSVTSKKTKAKTVYWLFALAVLLILIYGVVSEVIKLKSYGTEYSIIEIFSNPQKLLLFFERQTYRIFDIWTTLGGNIIELVDNEGYFYGLTYIKSIASLFGLPYISLPKISATFIMASYAQPGLVAEGYANFGIVGAIINILLVFILIETMFQYFMKKRTMFSLLLLVVPFSGILLDGGTLNDALLNIIFIILTCIFMLFLPKKKKMLSNKNIQIKENFKGRKNI